jgi:hypothetical protein
MTSKLKLLVASAVIPAAFLNAVPAFAAGTTQGTSITNNITVDYQVGGVNQNQINNVSQPSSSNTFVVDRKILFTINEKATTGTTSVIPGQTGRITTFLLTNSSNDVLDFTVTPANIVGGTAAHGGTDVFDVTNLLICRDNDANNVCDAAAAASLTVDNLAADASTTILILGDIPAGQTNGQVANVRATATALNSNGTAITAATDATVNGAGTVETIFADVAKSGNGGTSAARDGIDVATDDYTVGAANLTVTKLSRVVRDNLNGPNTSADPTNPKAVPGATVEYCIVVSNGASAATAQGVNVSDNLATLTNVQYDNTFQAKLDGTVVSGSTCTPGTPNASYSGGTNGTVSGTLSDIAAGETRTLVFRVTIQ